MKWHLIPACLLRLVLIFIGMKHHFKNAERIRQARFLIPGSLTIGAHLFLRQVVLNHYPASCRSLRARPLPRVPWRPGSALQAAHLAEGHEIVLHVGVANALRFVAVVGDDDGDRGVKASDAGNERPQPIITKKGLGGYGNQSTDVVLG